jgi:hypothetical protein
MTNLEKSAKVNNPVSTMNNTNMSSAYSYWRKTNKTNKSLEK